MNSKKDLKMESKKICSFTLDYDQVLKITKMAEASQRSRSDILRRAIKKYYEFFEDEWRFDEKEI